VPKHKLLALTEHGNVTSVFPVDEGYAEVVIAKFTRESINDEALATDFEREDTTAFA